MWVCGLCLLTLKTKQNWRPARCVQGQPLSQPECWVDLVGSRSPSVSEGWGGMLVSRMSSRAFNQPGSSRVGQGRHHDLIVPYSLPSSSWPLCSWLTTATSATIARASLG